VKLLSTQGDLRDSVPCGVIGYLGLEHVVTDRHDAWRLLLDEAIGSASAY
jgi:hypothetical protein